MKKVYMNGFKEISIGDYFIDSLEPYSYFPQQSTIKYFISMALRRWEANAFGYAEGVDYLYRTKNRYYMKYISDFIDKFQEYNIIIMSKLNFIHPEILNNYFKKQIKILGLIDDPDSTYIRGIPYFWAFDGVFYISKSYEDRLFQDELEKWGVKNSFWYPLIPQLDYSFKPFQDDDFFKNRKIDISYIGGYYGSKVDRLLKLKRVFKDRFEIYGRWPLKGYFGFLRPILKRPLFPYVIRSLSNEERKSVYLNTKIGFNLHLNGEFKECGNLRTYEVPMHGCLLLSNKAGANAHNLIFEDQKEAVYYDNLDDAIEKINYYLSHDEERVKIAKKGFERAWKEYDYEKNLLNLLKWAEGLKK
jgi:hypothetical protein